MLYRKEILDMLYKILSRNYFDGRLYINASERCQRLLFKNFFRKLSHQKRCFCKRIKYEIQILERELLFNGEEFTPLEDKWKELNTAVLPVIRVEREGLIKDCYRREKQNLLVYNNLLGRISMGNIREMLLFQKHSIQLILNEIESMGLKIYDLQEEGRIENGKTEGEKNYR